MKILGITGSVSKSSKTLLSVQEALDAAKQSDSSTETEILHLGDYETVLCDGRDPASYTGDTREVIDKIEEADAYIIGTPVYRGSLTGALKNVFDLIPNDCLRGKAIGFVATGGTYHHYLVIDHHLHPLAHYFRAHVIPGGVYVHNGHFEQHQLVDEEIRTRLHDLGEATVRLSTHLNKDFSTAPPAIPRKSLQEQY
ncbi:NADPH-dependent FMN reductase [Salimicrobium halophilum]|uniref:FMN reductase n=1 Tax=Salimicrobium halophilum TaxID=86666 RepID=A0A1G8VRF0_9BACI|nr:NAD(P)H-dependent oxidoreductase [Salimicrobium halophilum]SDJ68668.1 FMN reductase [Salimicrobium halophilum]